MSFTQQKLNYLTVLLYNQVKVQTQTRVHDITCDCCLSLVQTVERILRLGARASQAPRPPPQPATMF